MSIEREEVKYIFTGDTSSLSSATSEAIGLLDKFGNAIRKTVADSATMSKVSEESSKVGQSLNKMVNAAKKADAATKNLGSNINLTNAKKKIAAFVVAMGIEVGKLQYTFDPIIQKMQSFKSKATSAFASVSKMASTVASAFRRSSKESDKDSESNDRNTRSSNRLASAKNTLSKAVSGLTSKMSQLNTNSEKTHRSFASLLTTGIGLKSMFITFSGIQLGKFFSEGISQALHYTEVLNQFNVVLGDSIQQGEEFVTTIRDMYGLAPTSIMEMTSMFYQLASAVETPTEAARKMSLGLSTAALDIASLFDVPIEQAAADLASGMQGMTRAVRKYGLDLRMATLEQTALSYGLKINASTTSEANRQALRYITIMRQARAASGDFAKTIESPANQLRILKEQFIQLALAVGRLLLPALQAILPVLNGILMAITAIVSFIGRLLGIKDISFGGITDAGASIGSSMGGASDAVGGVGDAADSANKKAEKLKKTLTAPFDELNIFKEEEPADTGSMGGGGGGGVGGGGVGGLDPTLAAALDDFDNSLKKIEMKATKIRDTILEFLGFNYNVNGELEFDASQLEENLINAFPSWTQTITAFFDNWQGIVNGFKAVWDALANALKALFAGIVAGFTNMIQTLNLDAIVAGWIEELPGRLQAIADWINGHLNLFYMLGQAISYVGTAFAAWRIISSILGPIVSAFMALNPYVQAAVLIISALAAGFEYAWDKSETFREKVMALKDDFFSMCESLAGAWTTFWDVFSPIIDRIASIVSELWTRHLAPFLANVLDLVVSIIEAVANILTFLMTLFGPSLRESLAFIADIVSTAIGVIIDIINIIVDVLDGIIDFMNSVFKKDWKGAWEAIKRIFKAPLQGIINLAVGMANLVIDVFNGLVNSLLSLISGFLNTVAGALEGVADLVGIDLNIGDIDLGIRIPHIPVPKLATGGVVSSPTLSMIGEGAYPEAVVPLGDSPQMRELIERIAEATGGGGDDETPMQVNMYLDGKVIYKSQQKVSRKRGVDFKMGAFER